MPVASTEHVTRMLPPSRPSVPKIILRCAKCREVAKPRAVSCRICGGVLLPITATSGLCHAAVIVFNPDVSRQEVLDAIKRLPRITRSRVTRVNDDFGTAVILLD